MGYKKRYRGKNYSSSIISDVASIGAKVSWQGALALGIATFLLFYFILPAWLWSVLQEQQGNKSIHLLR